MRQNSFSCKHVKIHTNLVDTLLQRLLHSLNLDTSTHPISTDSYVCIHNILNVFHLIKFMWPSSRQKHKHAIYAHCFLSLMLAHILLSLKNIHQSSDEVVQVSSFSFFIIIHFILHMNTCKNVTDANICSCILSI